ncbi:MAG: sulfite oxidase [Acidobacteria bacterium]|nr:sulfite oxidase [Acidobacteriota bacterium]
MQLSNELVLRKEQPENLESPCSIFDSFLTPNDLFYVRNHFETPELDKATWTLKIAGAVERTREFTYADIVAMPSRTIVATLECAGNARTFLPHQAKGLPWGLGAVGNAEWTGVSLSAILAEAGLQQETEEIVLEGADHGEIHEEPKTPGVIHYARSLPLSKALDSDVLLAYTMNGHELTWRHGFPVRAVVPGWYGMASVKWLQRIFVTNRPFAGFFQTFEYSRWERMDGIPSLEPLAAGEVKAKIINPYSNGVVPSASSFRVHGAAWAGESEIATVEISVDGGHKWEPADLLDVPQRYCWVRWEYLWNTPAQPATVTLMARATDKNGRSQPLARDPDNRHYAVHHVLKIPVRVE